MITWKIEKRKISDLKGFKKNPRKFTEKGLKDLKKSLENLGDANIITINSDNTILGGHARIQVMKELGYKEVDVKVPDRLLNEKEAEETCIRLNANTAGEWDFDLLNDFDSSDLSEWGLNIIETPDNIESKYTRKVDIPIYEIKGEEPTINEMIDTSKADKLIEKINKLNIKKETKDFLIKTATRLYEFNYSNIAEFYCHQNKEVQEIMEELALVLIDLNKAVENGYVQLNEWIEKLFLETSEIEC